MKCNLYMLIIFSVIFFGCDTLTKEEDSVDMKTVTLSVSGTGTTVGSSVPVTVTGKDSDNHTHNIKSDVRWNISNSSVVEYKNGSLYAKSTGSAGVSVTYENDSGTVSSNTVTITVSARPVTFTFVNNYNATLVVEAWAGKSLSYNNGTVVAVGPARKVVTADCDSGDSATSSFALDSITEQKCFLLIIGLKDLNGPFYITHKVVNDYPDDFTLTIDARGSVSLSL